MVRHVLWTRIVASALALALPASASAGPLSEAVEKAGREAAVAQADQGGRSRGRLWTSLALIVGGSALAILGGIEMADSDTDEATDTDDAPGEDDGDAEEKAMLGGGIAAAGVGAILLMTGGRTASPSISTRPGRVMVRHTIRF